MNCSVGIILEQLHGFSNMLEIRNRRSDSSDERDIPSSCDEGASSLEFLSVMRET
jgi:hypothetical protein